MKLGLGLYKHMLNSDHYAFARQAGATHIVAHLVDYFRGGQANLSGDQPTGGEGGWGLAGDPGKLWSLEELVALREGIEVHGLTLAAIENFDPAHWHDVLLDGPRRDEHMENVKTLIRRCGQAGIPAIGYNFSLAGVAGRIRGPFARGGAEAVGMDGPADAPMPKGMVWNMVYDPGKLSEPHPPVTSEMLWDRVARFLREAAPAAEESGVRLAAHPDDPPMPTVRGMPRLVYQPRMYRRLLDLAPSPANGIECCVSTMAEMTEREDLYPCLEAYAEEGKIVYVHCRNVRGVAPHYREAFIDDGDVDMARVIRILRDKGFEGVVIPDHAPQLCCGAPWHAGMAHALGYLKALMEHA